jgi:DNA replication protein DnaC
MESERIYPTRITPSLFDIRDHPKIIQSIAPENWVFDQELKDLFVLLIKYFNGIESNLDLNKGIILMGPVGTGKSSTIHIIQKYLRATNNPNQFRFEQARIILREFSKDKYIGLEKYSFNYEQIPTGGRVAKPQSLCIDDIGLENKESRHYGESVDVIGELLIDRYDLFTDDRHRKLTHATSNLDTKGLLQLYGDRIYDRFKEMFNVIPLTGKSKRK